MQNEPINTGPIQQFLKQVKGADAGRAKDVTLDIQQAKSLAFTLGIVLARLNGDLEKILVQPKQEETIQVELDGGKGW
tara:strand:- start:349 stop:582 length:234 start_codon:yes stop_codon:yes gene_type:complete